jgi:Mg2+ and Co2+ transporter CorA
VAAATLSHRYIADRFLPDKAIDLIDEAASRLRMELDSMPTEIDQLERQILQLEIEQNALRKEKDEASRERLKKLERDLANLKEKSQQLKAQWQNEKAAINAVSVVNGQIEQAKTELEKAQRIRDGRPAEAGSLRDRLMREALLIAEALEGSGAFDRAEILALDVLDKGDDQHLPVVEVLHDGGNAIEARLLRGDQPSLPRYELELALGDLANHDRLHDAVTADRIGQLLELRFIELRARLPGVRLDPGHLDRLGRGRRALRRLFRSRQQEIEATPESSRLHSSLPHRV